MAINLDHVTEQITVTDNATNASLTVQSKGTGAFNVAAGSSGVNISNGGTVTAITRTAVAVNYTSIPAVALSAPTTAGGVQATASANMFLNTATVTSGGTGYTAGDVLTVVGGTPVGVAATLTVSSVSGGVITAVASANFAQYSALPSSPISVTGGTGSGATLTPLWGNGTVTITNAGSGYVEQPTVTFSGGGGSGAAAYATVGSGTTVRSIGSTVSFVTPGGEALRVTDGGGTSNSYLNVIGSIPATGGVYLTSSANSMYLSANNASTIQFFTNGAGNVRQFQIAHTASAVNFVQVTGNATTGAPTLSTQGSDTNISMQYLAKGIGVHAFQTGSSFNQFRITATTSAVNYLAVTGGATGVAPVMSAAGSDANIGIDLITKGTGALRVNTGGGEQFRVTDLASATTYISARGGINGGNAQLGLIGTGNTDFVFYTLGTGAYRFLTGGIGPDQFRITSTASAVNFVQVTGAATGGAGTISSQGSDTNINMAFVSKGSGGFRFFSQAGGARQFQINNTTSAVNYPIVTGAAAGGTPVLSVDGSDTDIDIRFTPKGAGFVRFGTYTAGALSIAGYIEIRDAGGTIRRLAVVA